MPAEEVERALTQLTNAELMFRRGVPPDAEYTFKHALVQDAAYETLLRNQRQALHARIASTIGNSVPGNCGNQAPSCWRNILPWRDFRSRASIYWQRAGARAAKNSSYPQAAG